MSKNRDDRHPTEKSKRPQCKDLSPLEVTIISFGYKEGAPPPANVIFDVRFLKNPFWVEELRPLTGMDRPVQEYVLQQPLADDFLNSVVKLMENLLPRLVELKIPDFTIAFGCTGGQHRSATMVEALSDRLSQLYPQYSILRQHRELAPPAGAGLSRTVTAED